MKLGNRIYTLRSERGMSQGALAEKLGVSRQAVSKWENGSAVPELEKLTALADLFGVTLDQLALGEAIPDAPAPRPQAGGFGLLLPLTANQIAGALLLVITLIGTLNSYWYPFHFFYFHVWDFLVVLPCLLGGVLCLCTRRGPALWCGWAAFLSVHQAVTGDGPGGWWELLTSRKGGYHIHRYTLHMWLQLLGALLLLTVTVWHFRRKPPQISKRLRRWLLAAAWAGVVTLPFLRWWMEESLFCWKMFSDYTKCLAAVAGQLWICVLAAALALAFTRVEPARKTKASLGERIYALRTEQGLSQGELANRLDVSRQSVSKWETGNAVPELEKLLAIARQFGVSLEQLARKGLPAPPARTLLSWGQLAGIGLLFAGCYRLFSELGWFWGPSTDLLCSILLLLGGAVCLLWPRCAGLWYLWTAGLLFDSFMRTSTLCTTSRLLLSQPQGYSECSSLAELAIQLFLLMVTLFTFRKMALPSVRRLSQRLAACWCLWGLLEGVIWRWVYPMTTPCWNEYRDAHADFRIFADSLSLVCLAMLLTVTAAAVRGYRLRRSVRAVQAPRELPPDACAPPVRNADIFA